MGFFNFFSETSKYVSPDEDAVREAEGDAPRQVSFHRRIVLLAVVFGVIGAIVGVVFMVGVANEEGMGAEGGRLFLAPFAFAAAGVVLGVALACVFAPTSFLLGPVGQKWMQLIGTQSVLAARIVCFLFVLLILGLPTVMGLIIYLTEP